MAENKEYYTQEMDNGSIQISEDVVASVTGMAVLEVEGVCGLSSSIGTDIAEMLGMTYGQLRYLHDKALRRLGKLLRIK